MGIRSLAGVFHHEIGPLHLSEHEFIPDEPLLDDSEVVVEQNGTAPPGDIRIQKMVESMSGNNYFLRERYFHLKHDFCVSGQN
ncbi:hypothetical protein TNIN_409771 [Trichonephila inaurata madagascariensis]|uniref:Uncharacterized protein n=1 Tax=Trichonephila inaurata madagascariensis TaxID=2747483 RepID=A0A8X6IVC9_9ARAC|nr:hypothetical protein TNIN_409771 [Trichonephila inaurata madagascariensis]